MSRDEQDDGAQVSLSASAVSSMPASLPKSISSPESEPKSSDSTHSPTPTISATIGLTSQPAVSLPRLYHHTLDVTYVFRLLVGGL